MSSIKDRRYHNLPFDEDILMPDYGVADTVRLVFHAPVAQDQIPGNNGTFELERHFGRRKEPVGRPDIVQKTGYVVRFRVV